MIKRSIRTVLIIFFIVVNSLSIIVVAYLGFRLLTNAERNSEKIVTAAIQNQSETLLVDLASTMAEKNDIVLTNLQEETANVADYARNIFENPDNFPNNAWKFDDHVMKGKDGQYSNGQEDVCSIFIPNYTKLDNDLKKEMELSGYLDYIFPTIVRNDSNAFAIYFIGLQGELRYYPNVGIENLVPSDIDFTKLNFFSLAAPENNSQRKVVWTPLYEDVAGLGLMITTSAPIYTKQKGFIGVLDIDVTLKTLITNIEGYTPINNSYSFLIDKDGYSIAMPEQAYEDILGRSQRAKEFQVNLNNVTTEFSTIINKMKEGSTGFQNITVGSKELYVGYAPLKSTGFSLAIVVEKASMLKAVSDLKKDMEDSTQRMIYYIFLPISIVILLLTFILAFFFSRSISNPIEKLRKGVVEISKGNLKTKIKIRSKDEIGELASAFNKMTSDLKASRRKLEDYTKNLEKKVKLRTKEVDKKIKESEEARIATLNILDDVEKTRKELEKTYKELKTMDRMKAEFMNVAAHELKTPLIPIVGYIDLLLKGDLGKINDKQMESLKTIQRNTTRLQRLIQDILDITKLESKVMKFDMKNIQIGDLVKDVANGMKISAEEKNIKMLVNIQTPLPLIYGDAQRLVQVLGDLIGNAIKFTDTGSITVEAKREKNFIKVSVTDTGIGIDKDFMPKLFQKFQQADTSAKRKFGGTGLGLAICKEIIEYHKGRIWTETKPGKGSTFIFVLPIKRR